MRPLLRRQHRDEAVQAGHERGALARGEAGRVIDRDDAGETDDAVRIERVPVDIEEILVLIGAGLTRDPRRAEELDQLAEEPGVHVEDAREFGERGVPVFDEIRHERQQQHVGSVRCV